jgi:NADH-quinone oxidoreductase subunit N
VTLKGTGLQLWLVFYKANPRCNELVPDLELENGYLISFEKVGNFYKNLKFGPFKTYGATRCYSIKEAVENKKPTIARFCIAEMDAPRVYRWYKLLLMNFQTVYYTNFSSFTLDYLIEFARLITCFCSLFYFLFVIDSLRTQKLTLFEFLLFITFSILGLIFICSGQDLITIYLSLELLSFAFYFLASFKKTSMYSLDSAILYFITGAISSSFFLLGSSFIYGSSGSVYLKDFFILYGSQDLPLLISNISTNYFEWVNFKGILFFTSSFLEIGIVMILFSLFVKIAAAPFYLWSLEVYEGSPSVATFFFAVLGKFSIVVLILKLFYEYFLFLKTSQIYFIITGVISVVVGSFGGITQRKLKVFIAYSSVVSVGYALLLLSSESIFCKSITVFFLFINIVFGLNTWFCIVSMKLKKRGFIGSKESKEIGDLSNLSSSNFALSYSFAVNLFALSGLPCVVGFLIKLHLWLPLVCKTYYFIIFCCFLFGIISTYYYVRVIKVMFFENDRTGNLYLGIKTKVTSIFGFLTIFSLAGLLFPNQVITFYEHLS